MTETPMTDLVERLKLFSEQLDYCDAERLVSEAGAEITRLQEQVAASEAHAAGLVEALKACVTAIEYNAPPVDFGTPDDPNPCYECRIPVAFPNEARAALTAYKGWTRADPNAAHPLTIIIRWFQELPLAARRGLSLANLHDLSKRLGSKRDASQTPGTNTNLGDTHD